MTPAVLNAGTIRIEVKQILILHWKKHSRGGILNFNLINEILKYVVTFHAW